MKRRQGLIFCIICAALICAVLCCITGCGLINRDTRLTSIQIDNLKTEFYYGEEFSVGEDFEVIKFYSNGEVKMAKPSEYEIDSSAYDKNIAGEYTIKVKMKEANVSKDYTVTIAPLVLERIVVKNPKSVFLFGEDFSIGEDFTVIKYYSNNTSRPADASEYQVDSSSYNKSVPGEYTIKVKMIGSNAFAQYTVTMEKEFAESVVEGVPGEYSFGKDFPVNSVKVYDKFADGSTALLDSSQYIIDCSNYEPTELGEYEITISIPRRGKSFSYTVTVVPATSLKMLMIGNSFSENAVKYIYQIAKDLGVTDVKIVNMYIGGCWLQTHYENILSPNSRAYRCDTFENGTWVYRNGYSLRDVLASESWDVITLQESSGVSGLSAGETSPNNHLRNLANFAEEVLRYSKNHDADLFWHMTWAYQQNSNHNDFPRYDRDQLTMYNAITNVVENEIENATYDDGTRIFTGIIPAGTSIQNARTSYIGDTLTVDGYHLNDLGCYMVGLTVIGAVTGQDVTKIEYIPSAYEASYLITCRESVANALANPYGMTESENKEKPEFSVDLTGYTEFKYDYTCGAYWNPSNTAFDRLVTVNDAFTQTFVATNRYTKEDIPVGSVIVLEEGWKYRPDYWTYGQAAPNSNRDSLTTQTYLFVTEEWWEGKEYRAFNISKTDGTKPADYSEAIAAFKIYIPKEGNVGQTEQ